MVKPLDPKAVQMHPAGHLSQEWQVRLSPGIAFADIFRPTIWADVEKLMRNRGPKRPRKDDLLRVIGDGFDVVCLIVHVGDGYGIEFYAGRRPSAVGQVLGDLDALPDTSTSSDCVRGPASCGSAGEPPESPARTSPLPGAAAGHRQGLAELNMTRAIAIRGFRIKNGKVEKDPRHLDASARLRQRASKKIRVARRQAR